MMPECDSPDCSIHEPHQEHLVEIDDDKKFIPPHECPCCACKLARLRWRDFTWNTIVAAGFTGLLVGAFVSFLFTAWVFAPSDAGYWRPNPECVGGAR